MKKRKRMRKRKRKRKNSRLHNTILILCATSAGNHIKMI
jgi:hypothetical protein